MSRRTILLVTVLMMLAAMPFVWHVAVAGITHLRHIAQAHFVEIHAALSDGDAEDGPGDLTAAQIAARDNVVTPIATPDGVVAWDVLAQAGTQVTEQGATNIITPVYTDAIQRLDHTIMTAKGYMFPLDVFGRQSHFLLSPYPPSCPFCKPAGPNELIEVTLHDPVAFTYDPVTIKGTFELLTRDADIKQGVFYRMNDAEPVS